MAAANTAAGPRKAAVPRPVHSRRRAAGERAYWLAADKSTRQATHQDDGRGWAILAGGGQQQQQRRGHALVRGACDQVRRGQHWTDRTSGNGHRHEILL